MRLLGNDEADQIRKIWRKKYASLHPEFNPGWTDAGAYCSLPDGTQLVSFSFSGRPSGREYDVLGQSIALFDSRGILLNETKGLYQRTLGDHIPPYIDDVSNGIAYFGFLSGDAGILVQQKYILRLQDFSFKLISERTNEDLDDFYCIRFTKDLHEGDGAFGPGDPQVKQLQHFINRFLHITDEALKEDGVFGPRTAAKVGELKQHPQFIAVADQSSTIDQETRHLIARSTCTDSSPITIPIEFDISAVDPREQQEYLVAAPVNKITVNDSSIVVPGSYGNANIVLDNPIDPKTLGINFSKGNFFNGCSDSIIAHATLDTVRPTSVSLDTVDPALSLGAHVQNLSDIKIKSRFCGD